MDGGSLNLRNDEVFNKLDSAPRKDVNKLIQLQKETNANNIAKQRRDSLNAIEESLFKLDAFENASADFKNAKQHATSQQKYKDKVFTSIVSNLSADNDSFLKKIEVLYNILFKSYKSELIIKKKLGNYDGSINDVDEYVKNRILGRIIFNIEYFRNFTKEYEKYDFEDVINQIKRIPESSMPQQHSIIRRAVDKLLQDDSSDVQPLIKLIKEIKKGGALISDSDLSYKTHIKTAPINIMLGTPPDPFNKIVDAFLNEYSTRLDIITNEQAKFCIKKGVKLIMNILYRLESTANENKLNNGNGLPEKNTESNLLEYVRRSGENALLVLTKDKDIKENKAKEAIINLILTQQFFFRNLDNKVNFYVLEVFYGIIYGTLLGYDLILKEENKYIIERVENLSQIYSIINDIIYDQTYRTLKQLYNKKNPGYRNIFRIDMLYNDIFSRSETNKIEKGGFTEENEYTLRDLVILKINNGVVDIKKFQDLLKLMYNNSDYQEQYKYLHEVSNIYNLVNEIYVLVDTNYDINEKKSFLVDKITKITKITKIQPDSPENAQLNLALKNLKEHLEKEDQNQSSAEKIKLKTLQEELSKTLKLVKTKTEEKINKTVDTTHANGEPEPTQPQIQQPTQEPIQEPDISLRDVLIAILDLEVKPEQKTFSALFNTYIEKHKKLGGASIASIQIQVPVTRFTTYNKPKDSKCNSRIVEPLAKINEKLVEHTQQGGDYEKINIKREELKAKLENPMIDDDITESVSDNAKRKLTKVKHNVKQFFNTTANVEEEIQKVLDEEYLDELKNFNINDVKTKSYKDLRESLYRIKNNEYFEDIKITNEDIYTFIATTYVLRVISIYITMWFIQIEIVKDVESVIVAYILTYILLFILIYTFVNLSDNQLDTSKSFLYYFYSRVNFSYTRFIVHLGLLLLLIIIPFIIRTIDKESASYKHISDTEKRYLYTFITNMSTIVWVILSIIAFFFK